MGCGYTVGKEDVREEREAAHPTSVPGGMGLRTAPPSSAVSGVRQQEKLNPFSPSARTSVRSLSGPNTRMPRGLCPGASVNTPGGIRTHDLCLRRAALYPAELRAQHMGSARNKPSSVRHIRIASRQLRQQGGIISLGPTLLPASSSLPGTQVARAAPRPLFGLAPGGVCLATSVTSGPVRSYRTLSPLPVLLAEPSAVFSLLHFPSPYDARVLPGTLPCGARTFLQRTLERTRQRSLLARSPRTRNPAEKAGFHRSTRSLKPTEMGQDRKGKSGR